MYLSTSLQNLHPTLIDIFISTLQGLEPRERLSVPDWADLNVKFTESSAKKGYWNTSEMEYMREPLESMADPSITEVTMMTSAQIGKTTAGIIGVGYFIDNDPSPGIVLQPTIDMAEKYSKTKLEPMLREMPPVFKKLGIRKSRETRNTMRYKEFPGGFLIITGANSPVDLASHSVKFVLSEDVDRIPLSAGQEGDPVMLAEERTESFKLYGRKLIRLSTPTIKQTSRIYRLYMQGDQREFYVPCPKCGEFQTLKFDNLKWKKDVDLTGKTLKHYPHLLYYECEKCKAQLTERDKRQMVPSGHWIPAHPEIKDHRSYKINRLYTPLSTWADITKDFIKVYKDNAALRVFFNTTLGEPWELEEALELELADLMRRNENYLTAENPCMPNKVLALTCAIDVQNDRLVLKIKGWGKGDEKWTINYETLYGDPNQDDVWDKAIDCLRVDYPREDGVTLRPLICLVDAGYNSLRVYEAVRYMNSKIKLQRGIFCIKGKEGMGREIWPRNYTLVQNKRYFLYVVGVDEAKEKLLQSLKAPLNNNPDAVSPLYNHFTSSCCSLEYFEELTAEKRVVKYHPQRGPQYQWIKKKENIRNEALDLEVYNEAAKVFMYFNYDALAESLAEEAKELADKIAAPAFMAELEPESKGNNPRVLSHETIYTPYGSGKNFVNSWRK